MAVASFPPGAYTAVLESESLPVAPRVFSELYQLGNNAELRVSQSPDPRALRTW